MAKDVGNFIKDQLRKRQHSAGQEFDENLNMIEQGYCDSLGFLELIASIEHEFGVEVDFSDLAPEEFVSISGLSNQINALLKAPSTVP